MKSLFHSVFTESTRKEEKKEIVRDIIGCEIIKKWRDFFLFATEVTILNAKKENSLE